MLLRNTLHFVRLLRDLGRQVGPRRTLLLGQAMAHIEIGDRNSFYHAARSCLVYRQLDLAAFDQAFSSFWRNRHLAGIPLSLPESLRRLGQPGSNAEPGRSSAAGTELTSAGEPGRLRYSAHEALRQRDFADLGPQEGEAV